MSRLAAIAICLFVFVLVGGCSSKAEQAPIALSAQMDVPEMGSGLSQKQQLTTDEVKGIANELLQRGDTLQNEIFAAGQSTADRAGRALQGISQASLASDISSDRVRIPEGDFDSIEKIKAKVESVFTPDAAAQYYTELFEGSDPIFLEKSDGLYYYPQYAVHLPLMDYDLENSIVMRQTIDEIVIEVTMETPGSTPVKKSLHMKKIGEEWRLDSVIFP